MKFVESVVPGDRVKVEGYGSRTGSAWVSDGRDSYTIRKIDEDWPNYFFANYLMNVVRFHLRNVVEIVECAPGAHVVPYGECIRCTSHKSELACATIERLEGLLVSWHTDRDDHGYRTDAPLIALDAEARAILAHREKEEK